MTRAASRPSLRRQLAGEQREHDEERRQLNRSTTDQPVRARDAGRLGMAAGSRRRVAGVSRCGTSLVSRHIVTTPSPPSPPPWPPLERVVTAGAAPEVDPPCELVRVVDGTARRSSSCRSSRATRWYESSPGAPARVPSRRRAPSAARSCGWCRRCRDPRGPTPVCEPLAPVRTGLAEPEPDLQRRRRRRPAPSGRRARVRAGARGGRCESSGGSPASGHQPRGCGPRASVAAAAAGTAARSRPGRRREAPPAAPMMRVCLLPMCKASVVGSARTLP